MWPSLSIFLVGSVVVVVYRKNVDGFVKFIHHLLRFMPPPQLESKIVAANEAIIRQMSIRLAHLARVECHQ